MPTAGRGGRPADEAADEQGASFDEPSALRSAVGLATVVLLALAAFVFVRATTPAADAPGSAPATGVGGLSGVLVYTAADPGPSGSRLWVWDFASGSVLPGPLVTNPQQLVELPQVGFGWVGVTSGAPGDQEALVVSDLRPTGQAEAVLRGQQIAWSPGGAVVNAASVHTPTGPCGRLVVRAYVVPQKTRQTRYEGHVCGQLAGFSRSTVLPFVALASNGGMTIDMVGNDSLLPVLRDHFMFGGSTAGDFLVEPMSCISPAPGPTSSHCTGLQLFFRSPGRPPPVNIGVPGKRLLADRVVGWTHDATAAYVLGTTVDGPRGLYQVRVAPIERPPDPEMLFPVSSENMQITETFNGRVIVEQNGAFAIAEGGSLVPLPRPQAAPAPDGPMVWLAALPYSSP